jgi:PKD repeat protein
VRFLRRRLLLRGASAPSLDRTRGRSATGQTLVELTLIIPILLLMFVITLDFGRLFFSYVTLQNVARVAANFGATNPDAFTGTPNTTTYDKVVGREIAGLNCDLIGRGGSNNPPLPPLPTFSGSGGLGSSSVAVMTCDFAFLTPLVTNFFSGPLAITTKSEFPVRTGAIANIGGTTTVPAPGGVVADFDFTGVSNGAVDGAGNVTGTAQVSVNVLDKSQNAQTWTWAWGDGQPDWTDDSAPPTHTYPNPGTYTVTLTVSNSAPSQASISRTVTVASAATPPPVAGFYGTPAGTPPDAQGGGSAGAPIQITRNQTVSFTNTSTGATSYSWDFGDGSSPNTGSSPSHVYTGLGVFSVTMSITSPTGVSPYPRTNYVTVGCVVPNFANTLTSAAAGTWAASGFSGTLYYQPANASGNSGRSTSPPGSAKNIVQQTLGGGDFYVPTRQNNNKPWLCSDDITVKYTP